ncbi:shikimate dehydrogenase [Pseudidiomarina aestuarii]|uniref:Shikimate dehydrogenase (NADP(+)) n=1 Tax=Pseudidiomarina aestuarii TaxID=624146 RepID=A0A7Z6ZVE8_9GAMM|nr:shikimate dehydrogenase [Pseudidiomarina aestuarii]RUO42089.1 shikimate dehydrogenase [Pseudidiomarina aestuarii]
MARFTVFGNPVQHSLSPFIHSLFAQQLHVKDLEYTRSLTSPAQFAAAVAEFFRCGGAGANVTVPFKTAAAQLVTHQTDRAARAGAVNTLIPLGHGQILGDNTDGYGLVADLKRQLELSSLIGIHAVILGAGGAARGVLGPLCEAGVERIILANRTLPKAQELVRANSDLPLAYASWQDLDGLSAHDYIVINATSASLHKASLPLSNALLSKSRLCYDMMYAKTPTQFIQQARTAGATACADGLGMLVEQAALAFALWHTGQLPETDEVLRTVRAKLLSS